MNVAGDYEAEIVVVERKTNSCSYLFNMHAIWYYLDGPVVTDMGYHRYIVQFGIFQIQ